MASAGPGPALLPALSSKEGIGQRRDFLSLATQEKAMDNFMNYPDGGFSLTKAEAKLLVDKKYGIMLQGRFICKRSAIGSTYHVSSGERYLVK